MPDDPPWVAESDADGVDHSLDSYPDHALRE